MLIHRRCFTGYILGLIIESAMHRQESTPHPDPIHVTAHFLRPSAVGPFEVHVRTIKGGKGFMNIGADFIQKVRYFPSFIAASYG